MTKIKKLFSEPLFETNNDLKDFTDALTQVVDTSSITCDDSTTLYSLVSYINTLPLYKRNLIYLYTIEGSYSAVARRLGVSTGIVYKYIREILDEIHNAFNDAR